MEKVTSTGGRQEETETLKFHVSAGLKRVLGRELITNDDVAIFELVKNSYDAGATAVSIVVLPDSVSVIDNGSGMTLQDLQEKWLAVAYSAKRHTSPGGQPFPFREKLAERTHYAGSKGIGRFSADRLGNTLVLQTRATDSAKEGGASSASHDSDSLPIHPVHVLKINWPDFDNRDNERFEEIEISHEIRDDFDLPSGTGPLLHGTIVTINELERKWSRDELRRLKRSLAKLINPFGAASDNFVLNIVAPGEAAEDELAKSRTTQTPDSAGNVDVINGPVQNFIFETLQEKTTYIDVSISRGGRTVVSELWDRGELIFQIEEPNPYDLLIRSEFKCRLYYLNMAAKQTFARRMGVTSVQFGSIFLFRNGFRVFPIGEEGNDWLEIDRRKQQGYNRFLGTRDLIGRIDVTDTEDQFQEGTSRDQGLILTPAALQIKRAFRDHVLKRLEKYVVGVTWEFKSDKNLETLEVIETEAGRKHVATIVASLVGNDAVTLKQFSRKLIRVDDEQSESFRSSLAALKVIARESGDKSFEQHVIDAERRVRELVEIEKHAKALAEEERKAKEAAEAKARELEEKLEEEQKLSSFLSHISTTDIDTLNNLHHQILIYTNKMSGVVSRLLYKLGKGQTLTSEDISKALETIAFVNTQIQTVSQFATKANFKLDSEYIRANLPEYLEAYVRNVASLVYGESPKLTVSNEASRDYLKKFKPIDIAIVVDNFISNARKAKASFVRFEVEATREETIITIINNGQKIAEAVAVDGRLFQKGVTTTSGSGLGLFHVRSVIGDMGGTVTLINSDPKETVFEVRIPK